MNKITVVGAIGSEKNLTLYTDTGKTVTLPMAGWKTEAILEIVTPAMAKKKPVYLDLDSFRAEAIVEQKTGGLLRFVRKVAKVFGIENRMPAVIGEQEQLVAVVDGKEIPGVEALQTQIEHAARVDATGLANFMRRIAAVIQDRDHEVHELLQFIKDGDLPIAADGSIIAYKKLYRGEGSGFPGWFVDSHTRRVTQREGSYVTMSKDLVDRSRRLECSAGFHIGRRSYMPSFSGDTIMLVKVAPEDVVCVPTGEPSKIRVMGYHIVAKLPDHLYALVNRNQPISLDPKGALLLGKVVAGDHGPVNEIVEVRGANGDDVHILSFTGKAEPMQIERVRAVNALDDKAMIALTPRQIREKAQAVAASLAVVEEAPAEPAPAPEPVQPKPKATKKAGKAQRPAPAADDELTPERKRALALHREGKLSQRAIERETGVPVRTLKRLLAKGL